MNFSRSPLEMDVQGWGPSPPPTLQHRGARYCLPFSSIGIIYHSVIHELSTSQLQTASIDDLTVSVGREPRECFTGSSEGSSLSQAAVRGSAWAAGSREGSTEGGCTSELIHVAAGRPWVLDAVGQRPPSVSRH